MQETEKNLKASGECIFCFLSVKIGEQHHAPSATKEAQTSLVLPYDGPLLSTNSEPNKSSVI